MIMGFRCYVRIALHVSLVGSHGQARFIGCGAGVAEVTERSPSRRRPVRFTPPPFAQAHYFVSTHRFVRHLFVRTHAFVRECAIRAREGCAPGSLAKRPGLVNGCACVVSGWVCARERVHACTRSCVHVSMLAPISPPMCERGHLSRGPVQHQFALRSTCLILRGRFRVVATGELITSW